MNQQLRRNLLERFIRGEVAIEHVRTGFRFTSTNAFKMGSYVRVHRIGSMEVLGNHLFMMSDRRIERLGVRLEQR